MAALETLPVITRHLLRYNHQSKIPFQVMAKSLYHQTSAQARPHMHVGFGVATHVSLSARIAASKGDRERILKSIQRAREGRVTKGEGVNGGRVWEEQIYPPAGGWLV